MTIAPANPAAAHPRMSPLPGAGPIRMHAMAPRADHIATIRNPAAGGTADAYTPDLPRSAPTTSAAPTPPTPAPQLRPVPGKLRMHPLPGQAGTPAMAPFTTDPGTPRMGALPGARPAVPSASAPNSPAAAGFAAPTFGTGLAAQRSFADALGAARRAEGFDAREKRTPEARAREAAEMLVATTLIEPIFKQLRESNNAAPPFAPGEGEKQFGQLLDHRLSADIVKSANFPIVDRLARDLLRTTQPTESAEPTEPIE